MCLQTQVIDNNDGVVDRVRRAHGLSDDYIRVVRGRGIYDASKGLETTMEAARIWGRRWRLQRRDDGP